MTDYKTAYEDARKEFRAYMKLAESRIAEKDAMIADLIRLLAELRTLETAHAFDDSDGIGECAVRVPLPGNGWYRCGLRKEDHELEGSMNRAQRIANLRESISNMQFVLKGLIREEQLEKERLACPECGRRQISGNDHFSHCSKAKLEAL